VCKSGSIFPKTGIFDPFFPEISGIFGESGDFPGKNFPEIGELSGGIFPGDFPEIGCIFACTRKKQEKTARFFRGFPGDFPGDFPGISRRLFSEKIRIFRDFHLGLPPGTPLRSARSGKNPQISGKVPGDFRNSRESPEKISRNSRKFRPVGFRGNLSEFSRISGIPGKYLSCEHTYGALCFVNVVRNHLFVRSRLLNSRKFRRYLLCIVPTRFTFNRMPLIYVL